MKRLTLALLLAVAAGCSCGDDVARDGSQGDLSGQTGTTGEGSPDMRTDFGDNPGDTTNPGDGTGDTTDPGGNDPGGNDPGGNDPGGGDPIPALSIEAALPEGQVGIAYSASLSAAGGTEPYRFAMADGSELPAGLSLAQDGVISGTPGVAGTAYFSVEVFDASNPQRSAQADVSLSILAPNVAPLVILTESLPDGNLAEAYETTIEVSGGTPPYLFSLGDSTVLPDGMQLSPEGVLSGTPLHGGVYAIEIQVDDSAADPQVAKRDFILTIYPLNGELLSIDDVELPDGRVGIPYAATLTASGGTAPFHFSLTADSRLPAGMFLDLAGQLQGTPLARGKWHFTAVVTDASDPYQMATRSFTLLIHGDGDELISTVGALRKVRVGKQYRAKLTATGGSGSYSWSLVSGMLPPGIVLESDGILRGITDVQGSFPFTVQIIDNAQANTLGQANLVLRSMAIGSTGLRFHMNAFTSGTVAAPYDQWTRVHGGSAPYTFSANGAPGGIGLVFDGSIDLFLRGTPDTSGQFRTMLGATELDGDSAWRFQVLEVRPAEGGLMLSTAMLPQGKVGLPYSVQLSVVEGGVAPFTVTLAADGALPSGLWLDAAGLLSGVPLASGAFPVVLEARDANGALARAQYWLEIAP